MTYRTRLALPVVVLVTLTCVGLSAAALAKDPPKRLTMEAIYDAELAGQAIMPDSYHWAPNRPALAYILLDVDRNFELRVADLASGESRVVLDSASLEALSALDDDGDVPPPVSPLEGSGLHGWSPDGKRLLASVMGRIRLIDPAGGESVSVAPSMTDVEDPKLSPDGRLVSFVRENDLWVAPVGEGKARQITFGGSEVLLHGTVDWVYGEEFALNSGYHWSPDSRFIAFLEMDEQSVPTYPIVDELSDPATVRMQRYPRAGDPNPRVRVGVVHVETGRTAWLDRAAEYIPRIGWSTDNKVAVQLLNRAQTDLELVLADPASGKSRTVLREHDEHWINIDDDLTFLDDGRLIWTSERTGLRHVYLYDASGAEIAQLTSGEFEVAGVAGVDQEGGWVYFTSNEANPLGRDLYRVRLDGGGKERVTADQGTHRVTMNDAATAYLDQFSSQRRVAHATIRSTGGESSLEIQRTPSPEAYGMVDAQLFELPTLDGAMVRVKLLKPEKVKRGKKYPVVVYVYGGPHAPTIRDGWRQSTGLWHQILVQHGYVVAQIDDRSSSLLGHKYEIAASRAWGPLAVQDHHVAVEWLRSLPYVDPDRLAVWGWSGGGFTTCLHLTRNKLFKVGVAVAPVTDWHLYDSIYTERYMGLPGDEAEAYDAASPLAGAKDLHGRLLIIHGTHDDNVHPQNTIQFVQALIEAGTPVDLMLYPNKRHGIRGSAQRIHLFNKILEYLQTHL